MDSLWPEVQTRDQNSDDLKMWRINLIIRYFKHKPGLMSPDVDLRSQLWPSADVRRGHSTPAAPGRGMAGLHFRNRGGNQQKLSFINSFTFVV